MASARWAVRLVINPSAKQKLDRVATASKGAMDPRRSRPASGLRGTTTLLAVLLLVVPLLGPGAAAYPDDDPSPGMALPNKCNLWGGDDAYWDWCPTLYDLAEEFQISDEMTCLDDLRIEGDYNASACPYLNPAVANVLNNLLGSLEPHKDAIWAACVTNLDSNASSPTFGAPDCDDAIQDATATVDLAVVEALSTVDVVKYCIESQFTNPNPGPPEAGPLEVGQAICQLVLYQIDKAIDFTNRITEPIALAVTYCILDGTDPWEGRVVGCDLLDASISLAYLLSGMVLQAAYADMQALEQCSGLYGEQSPEVEPAGSAMDACYYATWAATQSAATAEATVGYVTRNLSTCLGATRDNRTSNPENWDTCLHYSAQVFDAAIRVAENVHPLLLHALQNIVACVDDEDNTFDGTFNPVMLEDYLPPPIPDLNETDLPPDVNETVEEADQTSSEKAEYACQAAWYYLYQTLEAFWQAYDLVVAEADEALYNVTRAVYGEVYGAGEAAPNWAWNETLYVGTTNLTETLDVLDQFIAAGIRESVSQALNWTYESRQEISDAEAIVQRALPPTEPVTSMAKCESSSADLLRDRLLYEPGTLNQTVATARDLTSPSHDELPARVVAAATAVATNPGSATTTPMQDAATLVDQRAP